MSSQDTLNYAQQEQESAKIFQDEIAKKQAKIASLQKEAAKDNTFQKDVDTEVREMTGLEEKERQHSQAAQRLFQQYTEEKQHEQEEQLHAQQHDKSLLREVAEESVRRGLF